MDTSVYSSVAFGLLLRGGHDPYVDARRRAR